MITTIIAAAATSAFIVCACFLAYGKGRADGENNAYRAMEASVRDIAALTTMGAMANMPSNTNATQERELNFHSKQTITIMDTIKSYYYLQTPVGKEIIRTFTENGVTYYAASDIAGVFNHSNATNVLYHVPDAEALKVRKTHCRKRACWFMTTKGLLAYLDECSYRNPADAKWLKEIVLKESLTSKLSQNEEKIEDKEEPFTVVRCCEEYLVIFYCRALL